MDLAENCRESVARRQEKINAEDAEVSEGKANCLKGRSNRESRFLRRYSTACGQVFGNVQTRELHGFFTFAPFAPFAPSALIFQLAVANAGASARATLPPSCLAACSELSARLMTSVTMSTGS